MGVRSLYVDATNCKQLCQGLDTKKMVGNFPPSRDGRNHFSDLERARRY